MVGSRADVNQGTTVHGEKKVGRGQRVRSSEEASNDRGAKGPRKVVSGSRPMPSRKDPRTALRLIGAGGAEHRRLAAVEDRTMDRLEIEVSGAQACAAGRTLLNALGLEPKLVHRSSTDWKAVCPEIGPYGLGGRGSLTAPPILIRVTLRIALNQRRQGP